MLLIPLPRQRPPGSRNISSKGCDCFNFATNSPALWPQWSEGIGVLASVSGRGDDVTPPSPPHLPRPQEGRRFQGTQEMPLQRQAARARCGHHPAPRPPTADWGRAQPLGSSLPAQISLLSWPCSGQCCGDPSTAPKGPPARKRLFRWTRDAGCNRTWRRLGTHKDLPSVAVAAPASVFICHAVSAGAGFRMQSNGMRKLHLPSRCCAEKKRTIFFSISFQLHTGRSIDFFPFHFFLLAAAK